MKTKALLPVALLVAFALVMPGCARPGYRVIEKHIATTTAATIGHGTLSFPLPLKMPPHAEAMYRLCVQDVKQNRDCED